MLEASGRVCLLQPCLKNSGKRLIESPKIYFLDTALATFLTGLHAVYPVLHGPMAGALVETAVVAAWVRAFRHRPRCRAVPWWIV